MVVDDGSSDSTREVLDRSASGGALRLTAIHNEVAGGPGARATPAGGRPRRRRSPSSTTTASRRRAGCEAGLAAMAENPGAIVQGRTDPDPDEEPRPAPSATRSGSTASGPLRDLQHLLPARAARADQRFRHRRFPGGARTPISPGRAIESGAPTAFAPAARAYHAVHDLGPIGHLRRAWHWTDTMLVFARHPGLRKATCSAACSGRSSTTASSASCLRR